MQETGADDFVRQHMIGSAPKFLHALDLIRRIAACDATVLIHGETGTGKELAARSIHYLGQRRNSPFVPINCGAIPDALLESEFFGHVRGAFTDAKSTREGVVSQARGGTLFLDELEVLSPRGQIILLRFLQDQIYKPVGSASICQADVRIIGSTNADLHAMALAGDYRLDLIFRLQVLSLELPPLRERAGDAVVLADAFLKRFGARYGRASMSLATDALRHLEHHHWPGNVRELENLIHREVLLSDGPEITLGSACRGSEPAGAGTAVPRFGVAKARMIAEFEKAYVVDLLRRTHGNISLAARLAGKDRSRLGKLVKKHGLERLAFARERAG